jgi:hypothetical protein
MGVEVLAKTGLAAQPDTPGEVKAIEPICA